MASNLRKQQRIKPLRDELSRVAWNLQIDAVETLLLALACAGVDIDSPEARQAIESALKAIAHQMPT